MLSFVLLAVKKKSHLKARVMARTVQLLRHDAYQAEWLWGRE